MKKTYVKPTMVGETFAANEYFAACYKIYCVTPGTCSALYDDSNGNGVYDKSDRQLYSSWLGFSGCNTTHNNVEWDGEISPNGFLKTSSGDIVPVFYWKDKNGYHSTLEGEENWETNPNAS